MGRFCLNLEKIRLCINKVQALKAKPHLFRDFLVIFGIFPNFNAIFNIVTVAGTNV